MPDELLNSVTDNNSGHLPLVEALRQLRAAGGRALSGRELLEPLGLDRHQRQAVLRELDRLTDEGVLERRKDHRYALSRRARFATGTLKLHRNGFGFVTRGEDAEDVFIPARALHDAMDGDRVTVLVELRRGRGGARPEGRILFVEERARHEILGRFVAGDRYGRLLPLVPRIGPPVLIPPHAQGGIRSGQIGIARIDSWTGPERLPLGTITTVLGAADDPGIDALTVAYKFQLPTTFPPRVLSAAATLPDQVTAEERAGRVDVRDLPLVTIDGETARDFDDAVAVRREGDSIRLWVAIADVGHYVAEDGVLDQEARSRGTSVYFPDRVLPMLPERLSNGICSLNPGVERLVQVAELLFDAQGMRLERKLYAAVMRSRARLTYTEVHAWLTQPDASVAETSAELVAQARIMVELAGRLTVMRRARGSIDFDLPEAEIVLNLRGRPENIVRRERNVAHRIIEEFMLAANEAVAEYLAERDLPLLYRVHEAPALEKLFALQAFVAHFNYGLALDQPRELPRALQALLDQSSDAPEARAIHQLMLRSMKQAYYAPVNQGHFGLAAERYCHFTSPIRRYPDLVVHRALHRALTLPGAEARRGWERWRALFPALGEAMSGLERRAMEAERDMLSVTRCRFMADKIGEEFDGTVAGVQPFGLFVELNDWFVEGLVAIAALDDDYYEFDPERQVLTGQRRRRTFRIGDAVRVRVMRVDIDWREIDFVPVETAASPLPRRRLPRVSGRKRHGHR